MCIDCEPYTRAQKDGLSCAPDVCIPPMILIVEGTCILDCPQYTRLQENGQCLPDECGDR